MDRILIRDLLVQGVIGVYEAERQAPQEILINLAIEADLSRAGESDDLSDSLNYAEIAARARQIAETARRFTVEALAADLARMCLSDPRVQRVTVRVEKPTILTDCRSVGVEIERSRDV
jgi:FolB domain-containing protein